VTFEFHYLKLLRTAQSWSIEGDQLTLQDAEGANAPRFERDIQQH
jgi:hypothetical protein